MTEEGSSPFGHTDAENMIKVANILKPETLLLIHHSPNRDRYKIPEAVIKCYPNTLVANNKEFFTNRIR